MLHFPYSSKFFVLALMVGCAVSGAAASVPTDVAVDTNVVTDVRQGSTMSGSIHSSLPRATFVLVPDVPTNTIQEIQITFEGNKIPGQTIAAGQGESPYRDSDYFQLLDINFDGYKDIGLLSWWGATGNQGWQYWRFDPASHRFVLDEQVSALGRPEFDSNTKTIRSFSKAYRCNFTHTIYRYEGSVLKPFEEEGCRDFPDAQPGDPCDCHKRSIPSARSAGHSEK